MHESALRKAICLGRDRRDPSIKNDPPGVVELLFEFPEMDLEAVDKVNGFVRTCTHGPAPTDTTTNTNTNTNINTTNTTTTTTDTTTERARTHAHHHATHRRAA